MKLHQKIRRLILTIFFLLAVIFPVLAQAGLPIRINLGENQIGALTQNQNQMVYLLELPQAQLVTIQVLALTNNFTPSLRIFDPSGANIYNSATASTNIESSSHALLSSGDYLILVTSPNNQTGEFVLSLQDNGALPVPQALSIGQRLDGLLSPELPFAIYQFNASGRDILRLSIRGTDSNPSPRSLLQELASGETIAFSNGELNALSYSIPLDTNQREYRLQIVYNPNSTAQQSYELCLALESSLTACGATASVNPSPTRPNPIPQATNLATLIPLPTTGQCVLASNSPTSINVRGAASTTAVVLGQLNANLSLRVVARLADSSWYQVDYSGVIGWVSASVARLGGNCSQISVANPNPSGGMDVTTTTIAGPTITLTVTQTPTVTAVRTAEEPRPDNANTQNLDFSLGAIFGSTALTSGFAPDPYSVSITSSGSVDTGYLGCTGFTTAAPHFSLIYTAGAFTLLRFYFIGSGDATIIVNSPSGQYRCNDDSFGTINPSLDYNSPSSGRYDIWIGSYSQGQSISGLLYMTEVAENHP